LFWEMPLWLTCEIVSCSLSQADFLSSLPHAAADVASVAARAHAPAIRIGVLRIELDSFRGAGDELPPPVVVPCQDLSFTSFDLETSCITLRVRPITFGLGLRTGESAPFKKG
jgi:hypothetical protein